ncbi:unnamed protein product [Pieris brassicae]|uniref:Uncharacterized protein n=1 Tax=Pieris brassicae TaxID=7116 RepID=A0A9P0XD84_PIEBR|nr:unnamed protein product [Pieris brassicae]
MITRPNKKNWGPKKVESGNFFFLESWQRRFKAGRARVQSAHSSLAECDGGHRCAATVHPMTSLPACPAHSISACQMDRMLVALETPSEIHVKVILI